ISTTKIVEQDRYIFGTAGHFAAYVIDLAHCHSCQQLSQHETKPKSARRHGPDPNIADHSKLLTVGAQLYSLLAAPNIQSMTK
uniref:Uncharacterized protein n=1 Tax=Romanomermis culicivorax TaxID=13658 RepID=A0A915JR39_ROMCU